MSLGIIIKAPEGIVLAADSRVTLTATAGPQQIPVSFDNAKKVLRFQPSVHRWVGMVTYGAGAIGLRTAHSFLPEIEERLPQVRQTILQYATFISQFFMEQWRATVTGEYVGPPMTFNIGGFNQGEAYGRVYTMDIPTRPEPLELNPSGFGITWGGQAEVVNRLLSGYDAGILQRLRERFALNDVGVRELAEDFQRFQLPTPIEVFGLQDLVNLALFYIRTTIQAQSLSIGIRGVGGAIDVGTITRSDGFNFVQQKNIKGEFGSP